jgi:small-conductance mechanosensitive channel
MRGSPLAELAQALSEGLAQPRHAWEAGTIAVAVAGGWLLARLVRRRVDARVSAAARASIALNALQFSIEGFRRLAFPAAALLLLWAGEGWLRAEHILVTAADARLMRLAMFLVGALGLVRLFVYALRRALHDAALITVFERALGTAAWAGIALYATGVLGDVVDWLQATRFPVGNSMVSLWSVLAGTATTLLSLLVAMWLGSLIDDRLRGAVALQANLRVVLGRVLRALLIVIAVLLALSLSGIDLTVLSVFGGALGVGLGLGLQRIASNYVSGFILLLDNSLRIGDLIAVDKYYGWVTQISTRYTVLRAFDGTEAVIPNEMLVSSPVTNQSLTDRRVRVGVRVTIAYDADLKRAMELLEKTAREHPRVLADPAPQAFLVEFAPSGLLLELGFWINDPHAGQLNVQSDVSVSLYERFAAAGIVIPYPRRDVRVIGADPAPDGASHLAGRPPAVPPTDRSS